jgi:hypothetical protein
MKVVHVLRKPCSREAGTVAANVLRHGVGALNIDASRVAFTSEADEQESKIKNQHADFGSAPLTGNVTYGDYSMVPRKNYNPPGRWPANLVLQHLDGCRREGTKEVRVVGATAHKAHHKTHSWAVVGTQSHDHPGYRNADGNETVAAWTCEPGCPVAALDEQSGDLSSQATRANPEAPSPNHGMFGVSKKQKNGPEYLNQVGGASRFFRQVGGGGS